MNVFLRMMVVSVIVFVCVGVLLMFVYVKDVIWEDIFVDSEIMNDVLMYGMGNNVQCYLILIQINVMNVKYMCLVWVFFFGDEKQCGQEMQVIVYDGVIYVMGFYLCMWVLDVKIGKWLWKFEVCLFEDICFCCDVVN